MTFSIVARCARTGRLGSASTTFSLACGARSEGVRPGIGVSKVQANPKRSIDVFAGNMLALGFRPERVLQLIEANDPDFEYRQIGLIAPDGPAVAHTGPRARDWAGHRIGPDCAAFGNTLRGPQVVDGIVAGFLAEPEAPLEHRLLRALEGGRDAGAQHHGGERSAWLRVVDRWEMPLLDLRVDRHTHAVHALRRVLEVYEQDA